MRKIMCCLLIFLPGRQAPAQSAEIEQLLLDVSKLTELRGILQDMYSGYQTLHQGYEDVKNIAKGNFTLHDAFLTGLLAVSPNVQNDQRIADIVNNQLELVQEYKSAYGTFRADPHFTEAELSYLSEVYGNLVTQSANDVEELTMVITAGALRMSDDERLTAIDRIDKDIKGKLSFLRYFNNNVRVQAVQRAKAAGDAATLTKLYGL